MKKPLAFAIALILGLLIFIKNVSASEKIRVLVMDDLPGVTLNFPPEFDVKGLSGIGETEPDGRLTGGGQGGTRIVLEGDNCPSGGVRINTDGVVINVNKYALTGVIEIKKNARGRFSIINELGLEDYTRAVVGEEMGAGWPLEALKAQAVLARTYAIYRKQNRRAEDYDLCSTVNSQMFNGDAKEKEGPAQAARETAGEILTYDGAPIEAVYHSTCGGRTEDARNVWGRKIPYLISRKCRYCADSPYSRWNKRIKITALDASLRQAGYMIDGLKAIHVLERSRSKRIKRLRIIGDSGSVVMKGTDFRKALGYSVIPSTAFEAHRDGDCFVFIGKGSGHGVGLCQYGAKGMAEAGKSYQEILQYYYPGVTLAKLPEEESE
ncbi:MAG: SpoIID/LytB domain-containing protein [Nitrospirota bacterium]